jgi:putative transposase
MYRSENHSKYNLKVHFVFVVKYRRKLINKDINSFLKVKIKQVERRSNFKVELMETDKDHIHLLIDYGPKVSVLQIVRRLKQETTFELWKVYKSYLEKYFWKEHTFWSDGYFACSIGECASYDTIQEYIKNQG